MRRLVLVIDVLALVLFVAIGRASHHDGETVGGFLSTVWPFAVGTAVGWAVTARRAAASLRTGALVCVATVAIGMGLRVVAGQGTAAAFVVVATGFLGLCMVGGRAGLQLVRRRARSASSPAAR